MTLPVLQRANNACRIQFLLLLIAVLILPGLCGLAQSGADSQACCYPDGTCENTDIESCLMLGGEPQGEGTTCSDITCPQPKQACCFPNGTCDDLPEGTCLDAGGTPQGDGSRCATASCPQPEQACCFPNGTCDDLPEGTCLDADGTPQGDGSRCATASCPQPDQACCFPDGTCEDVVRAQCVSKGGVPQGSNTDCVRISCPEPKQACCFTDGTCYDLTPRHCTVRGGEPQDLGSTCRRTSCPEPNQACCLPDGTCVELSFPGCVEAGGTAQETGTNCREAECPRQPLLEISLLSPLPVEGDEPLPSSFTYCWEGLGIPGTTYEVFHQTKQCDPEVVNGPHPLAPLFPDSSLPEARRDLDLRRWASEVEQSNLTAYCAKISQMFDRLSTRRGEIEHTLGKLEEERDRADAAQVDSEDEPFELPLPTRCPTSAESLLAPYSEALEGLRIDACEADACRGLSNLLRSLIDRYQSLDASAAGHVREFRRLLTRWLNGADHRGTMELYHGLFSLVDKAISLITDLIDALTPDLEEALRGLIKQYLTDAVCAQSPGACEALENAETVQEQLTILRGILQNARRNGTPGPAFIVRIVQAMAQQAAAATAVAVEGWANFAELMSSELWDGYESLLCELSVVDWLLAHQAAIEEMCRLCQQCLIDRIAQIDEELGRIDRQEQEEAAARQAYWQEQLALISSQIALAKHHLDPAWLDACCTGAAETTVKIPGSSTCAEHLDEALKKALGDKACFMNFTCTIKCEYENGSAIGASIECEHDFPSPERRFCCCVPCDRQSQSQGQQADPGRPGEPVCLPGSRTAAPEGGTWGVEARDQAGRLVASSPRRPFRRPILTDPYAWPGPTPSPGCSCQVSIGLNGAALPPGTATLTVQRNMQQTINVIGDCGPNCDAGMQSITIRPPAAVPAWHPLPFGLAPVPFSVAASSTAYDFPVAGSYTVTATQACEDGQQCSATLSVRATEPPGPVPHMPNTEQADPSVCPWCGKDECLMLSYQSGPAPPMNPLSGHLLKLLPPAKLELELSSTCRPDCETARQVRWEFTEPDGTQRILEGADRYRVPYTFDQTGLYVLCAIETVPCSNGECLFENWWIFEVEPGDATDLR